jgi:predicted phosphodiesterase
MQPLKLGVVSDLHLDSEFSLPRLRPPDTDALIIAGDLVSCAFLHKAVPTYLQQCKLPTIVIAGNHDYYLMGLGEEAENTMRAAFEIKDNIHYLQMQSYDIRNFRILGTTLWTGMTWMEEGVGRDTLLRDIGKYLLCPRHIKTGDTPFLEAVIALYHKQVAWLEGAVAKAVEEGMTPVVVTHFCPSRRSVDPKYKGQALNPYFANDLPDDHPLFKQVALWIHGHTHTSFDYMIGGCRVLCNPRGYGHSRRNPRGSENPAYQSNLVVEVAPR